MASRFSLSGDGEGPILYRDRLETGSRPGPTVPDRGSGPYLHMSGAAQSEPGR